MLKHACIHHMLEAQAQRTPEAPAILAPGRVPLTYSRLWVHINAVVQTLHSKGLGRNDRIALVLPNGPEMAVSLLAVTAGATCAPLNPAYSAYEFDALLADLRVKALIIQENMDSLARAMAQAHGISIIELSPLLEAQAGLFTLTGESQTRAARRGSSRPDDLALVLPTSGTTSRPKIVPLTHTNVCTSACNTRAALELSERDRCLNVMPLFHSHGLMGTLLPSLAAGTSIVCTPGFSAPQFFAWMAEFHPTWYTAVPTIHQAILARAVLHRDIIARCPLRFIRSASAALPRQMMTELESMFHAPVIESYGMTEASSLVTCNPLPPRVRKPGSVGVTVGPEVAIMDEVGTVLPAGETGEIVVRGASVMHAYENNPTANREAFTHGWFRTGDQGYLDADGYLFITGRFKEMINRGGEKIAPWEVDEVLMDHPAVAQAVTYAVPHAQLGEDIAAAVVLHQDATATDSHIRRFAATRLVHFKVPNQIRIVKDIPKGPMGKPQRIGLAEKLNLTVPDQNHSAISASHTAPRTPVEEMLVGLWAQVLDRECVSIDDNFFQLGGESLLATQLISHIRQAMQVEVSFLRFLETPTVSGMARSIETARQADQGEAVPAIEPIPRQGALPASVAQEQLWFIDRALSDSSFFNVPYVMRLTGALNEAALARSFNEIVKRHEALRTNFAIVNGRLVQTISPTLHVPLMVEDLHTSPETEWEDAVWRLAREEARQSFNLHQGPLLRVRVLRLSERDYVLLLTMHHIITDRWSIGVLAHELAVLYHAFSVESPSPLPVLPIQYADFAFWQHQWRHSEAMETQLAYWKQQLSGSLPMLEFPMNRPRATAWNFRTVRQSLVIPEDLSEDLKRLSRQEDATLFMTLLAAFEIVLYGATSQEDLCVGTYVANRNRLETEGLIGFFVNTILLRTNLCGNPTFRQVLQRVRETALAAYDHQDLPFEDLARTLERERNLKPTSLCQVMFILQNTMPQPLTFPGLTLRLLAPEEGMGEPDLTLTTFDVSLVLRESSQGLSGSLTYKTTLLDAAMVNRMIGSFQRVLRRVVSHPDQTLSTFGSLEGDQG